MIYLCYDTALNEEYTLVQLLKRYPCYLSLFSGTDDESIWDAAPYLFEADDDFYALRKDGLVQLNHCLVFETSETIEEVCRFLQYYIYQQPDNGNAYFRVWDARVLLKHLPLWSPAGRKTFFEFFHCFYTESSDPFCLTRWQPDKVYNAVSSQVLRSLVLKPLDGEEIQAGLPVADPVHTPPGNDPAAGERTPEKRRRFFID